MISGTTHTLSKEQIQVLPRKEQILTFLLRPVYTLLEAQEVTSASDITLKQGGILKARELSLSGSAAKIHMNGGLLSTSMDQFLAP